VLDVNEVSVRERFALQLLSVLLWHISLGVNLSSPRYIRRVRFWHGNATCDFVGFPARCAEQSKQC